MIRVHTAPTLATVANVKNALEANGIACILRNDRLGSAAGGLPPTECWPEVWVENDSEESRARELIAQLPGPAIDSGEPWRCGHCSEEVDSVFGKCWNCGTERPADEVSPG